MYAAESRLHYRSAFDLRSTSGQDPFRAAVFALRRWVEGKERTSEQSPFRKDWFFRGGQWMKAGGGATVLTRCETGGDKGPAAWAFRYEHLDLSHQVRFWRTEVGLEHRDEHTVRVAVRLGYGVRPGFVGAEPEEPTPSCPNIVKELLKLQGFSASIEASTLTPFGHTLIAGRGNLFVRLLTDPKRVVPVAVIGLNEHGVPALTPRTLAGVTAGTLDTWVVGSEEVHEELEHLLPRALRVLRGMVRLYQSRVLLNEPERDARRHRFFTAMQLEEQGEAAIIGQIAEAVSRRFPVTVAVHVSRPEDVEARNRTLELRGRLSREARSESEWNAMLQQELERLAPFEPVAQDLERNLQDANDQVDSLEHALRTSEARAFEAEQQARELKQARALLDTLSFPETLDALIDWVQALCPGRLVFTEEARQSARDAKAGARPKELPGLFELLRAMATELHTVFFEDRAPDPATRFRNQTGFELAMTEGSTTKKNPELMRLRRVSFEGREIDITPHVKYGNDRNAALRVHFFVDHDKERLVIGHCGNHLDTAGTRRM